MQTDGKIKNEQYNNDDFLDLGELFYDYVRCVKKYWLQFVLVVIMAVSVTVTYMNWNYEPSYASKITYAVNKTGDAGVNAYIAKSLSGAVPAITATSDFKADLLKEVAQDSVNYNYVISSSYTEGSNLFSISISSNNYKNANIVLHAMETVYPVWASKSNGTVELQVVDKSEASATPANPYSIIKSMLSGLVLGAVICFVLATWYVLTVKTVRKESDMKKITGKGCFSQIPEVKIKKRAKSKKEQLLISKKRIDWGFKQSILALQSRIEKQMVQNESQVLLVTSTLPLEGKSLIAANLALTFAKRDKKVLLIDGDLRNPSVEKTLGFEENNKGLIDFFNDRVMDGIIASKEGVNIIGAGTKRGDITKNISELRMQELMKYLRDKYEYIIIDTPPSHLFTDAAILEKYADCVLYVVRYDMAEMEEIKDGIAPFIRNEKLLGYCMNRTQGGFSTYGKYGYSKYGRYGSYKKYIDLDETSMNTEESL